MKSLEFLLTPRQQRILAALLLHPEQELTLADLLIVGGAGNGATQTFIKHLLDSNLVIQEVKQRQKRYRANTEHPIFGELASICRKTFGVRDVVAEALAQFKGKIVEAFIFGSVARGEEKASSDVDIMVVGNVRRGQLIPVGHDLEKKLGREVHLNIYDPEEWNELNQNDPVVSQIAKGAKINVLTTAV